VQQVLQSFAKSQENLRTTYIDSLILHSLLRTHELTMEVWRSMEHLVLDGKVGKSLSLVLMPSQRQRGGDDCGLTSDTWPHVCC
jgi:aryl-alcohol dehydrogenase-like predicted oxidoreductase